MSSVVSLAAETATRTEKLQVAFADMMAEYGRTGRINPVKAAMVELGIEEANIWAQACKTAMELFHGLMKCREIRWLRPKMKAHAANLEALNAG